VEAEVDQADTDHQVAERHRALERAAHRDPVGEHRQDVAGLLGPVLHRHLGGRTRWDRVRHAEVQRDHEGVHGDADRDHAHPPEAQVRDREAEDARVRQQQQRKPEIVEAGPRQVDDVEPDLEPEAHEQKPGA